MPFDDLDLEFEDEEEQVKKKKSDAVQVDVDLEFSSPEMGHSKAMPRTPVSMSLSSQQAEVKSLDDAREAQVKRPPTSAVIPNIPRTLGTSALKEDVLPQAVFNEAEALNEVKLLRQEIKKVELEAGIKVALAEYKLELFAELNADTKLMQFQIEQLLIRISAKRPDMKQEVLLIKKILADFTTKKRK